MARLSFVVIGVIVVAMSVIGKMDLLPLLWTSSSIDITLNSSEAFSTSEDALSMLYHKQQQWAAIQEFLCPNGLPNTDSGPKLFSMARTALGITSLEFEAARKNRSNLQQGNPNDALTYRFFHGKFSNAVTYNKGNSTVAYIPVWKAANNAIRHWMTTSLAMQGAVERIKIESLFNASTQTTNPSCVVTAIRDPISHFLSGYNEIEFRRQSLQNYSIRPLYYDMPHETTEQQNNRFVQFVKDFAMEESKALVHEPFGHVFSMSRVLTTLSSVGGFLSGYLPSIEHLSTEFPSFVTNLCHLEDELPVIDESMGRHSSSNDPDGFYQTAKNVWYEQGKVARALCAVHAIDYACWKDLPDRVPRVCEEYFSSPDFVTTIFDN